MSKKILLIDDEVDFTELTGTLLRFHDFEVDVINESVKVDESLANGGYHLIVTDLMMPEVDGFKVVQKIRDLPEGSQTPIIVLSAKILSDEERKFIMQKEAHFIMKPFEPQDLVEKIRTLAAK